MGLVVVVLTANFGGWDGLPNPLGWLLVLLGVRAARDHLPSVTSLTVLGWIALAVSVITYPPAATKELDPAATWLLDLPQVAFEVVLCSALATVLGAQGRWFRTLMWVLVFVGAGPAIAIGSDDAQIADIVETTFVLGQITLIWMLFSRSRDQRTGAEAR